MTDRKQMAFYVPEDSYVEGHGYVDEQLAGSVVKSLREAVGLSK